MKKHLTAAGLTAAICCATSSTAAAADADANTLPETPIAQKPDAQDQNWNWHVQNTDILQGDLAFPAKYSGPNSLDSRGEIRETVSLDLMAGARLWRGAEAHLDGLMWQGFG